ncbi:hypothetical protein [Streptomyces calidiresistens]|nr:hypothetical protein [Streptomyces calidiresistens]
MSVPVPKREKKRENGEVGLMTALGATVHSARVTLTSRSVA